MQRLRQFVRSRLSHVALLLALAGQLAGAIGMPVRLRASSSPHQDPMLSALATATPTQTCCCCTGGDTSGPCRCCCAGRESAPLSANEPAKSTLTLAAEHCPAHQP